MIVEVSLRQASLEVNCQPWADWLKDLFCVEGFDRGEISIAVVDGAEMQRLNQQYLEHDYPTDVLNFVLERNDDHLEGEIIVSAEMAIQRASEFEWSAEHELALYVIHGALHLAGYLDKSVDDERQMRERELFYLDRFGLARPSGRTRSETSRGVLPS